MTGPARSCAKVEVDKALEALVIFLGQVGVMDPVGYGVHPSEEDHRPGYKLMVSRLVFLLKENGERTVLQGRDNKTTDWEKENGDIAVKDQCGGVRHHQCDIGFCVVVY